MSFIDLNYEMACELLHVINTQKYAEWKHNKVLTPAFLEAHDIDSTESSSFYHFFNSSMKGFSLKVNTSIICTQTFGVILISHCADKQTHILYGI